MAAGPSRLGLPEVSGAIGAGTLPVLPALRDLLPRGGLARGSVVTVAEFGLLTLALAAGASADGAWCGIAGVPEAGVLAAAGLGLDAERTLLVPDPGRAWPQVVASLLDGCELVLLRPPTQASPPGAPGAQVRQRLEATLRRGRGVLLVVGDWPGAHVHLRILSQGWTGLGDGHGQAPGLLRAGNGRRPRAGCRSAYPLALAASRRRPRHRGRTSRHPRAGPRIRTPPAGGRRMNALEPRIMVLCCLGLSAPGLFDQVLTAVTAFCPGVEAVEPGVCAFGARGPARYFGGERALAGRIIAAVADLGVQARVGVADGLFAAQLAARGTRSASASPASASPASGHLVLVVPPGRTAEFLARQPVSVLADQDPASQDLASLLNRLGLRTLGDLAALPAGDVASRFGAAGETVHRLARGLGSRPLAVRPPAEDLSVTQEFDPPEPLAEPVVFAAKALAERMHEGLAARGLTCVRVQVRAISADGRESRRLWRHDGLLSAAAVADRVRWQLDGWRVSTAPAAPVGPANANAATDADAATDANPATDAGAAEQRRDRHNRHRRRNRRGDHGAAAGAGPGGPRCRASARALGGDRGQRPGGAGRHARAGHARARGRAAPGPGRRAGRVRPGEPRPVR